VTGSEAVTETEAVAGSVTEAVTEAEPVAEAGSERMAMAPRGLALGPGAV